MNPYLSWDTNTLNHEELQHTDFLFENSVSIQPECTNQESSGRCWLFAGLNMLRVPFIKAYDLPLDFEFSQNYLFFWDKYERAKYFLQTYRNVKAGNAPVMYTKDDRLSEFLLKKPVVDGGQWNMLMNLINKYGLVPKSFHDDVFASKNSMRVNMIINNRLKKAIAHNEPTELVMREIYTILVDFLGKPPALFEWRFKETKGGIDKGIRIAPTMTPVSFYECYVKPLKGCNLNEYVSIIHDPRNAYNSIYTVDYLNNMVGGDDVFYVNRECEDMVAVAKESISQDLPVWFGADVMPFTSREYCLSGMNFFEYPSAATMTKKERLETLDSALSHAMVLHGFDFSRPNKAKWKVENSWGQKGPYKGYYIMDHSWFENYVYQVSVHRSIVDKLDIPVPTLQTPPIRLPPWDAFGSLAGTLSQSQSTARSRSRLPVRMGRFARGI